MSFYNFPKKDGSEFPHKSGSVDKIAVSGGHLF